MLLHDVSDVPLDLLRISMSLKWDTLTVSGEVSYQLIWCLFEFPFFAAFVVASYQIMWGLLLVYLWLIFFTFSHGVKSRLTPLFLRWCRTPCCWRTGCTGGCGCSPWWSSAPSSSTCSAACSSPARLTTASSRKRLNEPCSPLLWECCWCCTWFGSVCCWARGCASGQGRLGSDRRFIKNCTGAKSVAMDTTAVYITCKRMSTCSVCTLVKNRFYGRRSIEILQLVHSKHAQLMSTLLYLFDYVIFKFQ